MTPSAEGGVSSHNIVNNHNGKKQKNISPSHSSSMTEIIQSKTNSNQLIMNSRNCHSNRHLISNKLTHRSVLIEPPPPHLLEPLVDIAEDLGPDGTFTFTDDYIQGDSGGNIHLLQQKNIKTRRFYECDICSSVYDEVVQLRKHYLNNHVSREYISLKDLKTYGILDGGEDDLIKNLNCIIKKTCSTENDNSGQRLIWKCHICQSRFTEKMELKTHLSIHPPFKRGSGGKLEEGEEMTIKKNEIREGKWRGRKRNQALPLTHRKQIRNKRKGREGEEAEDEGGGDDGKEGGAAGNEKKVKEYYECKRCRTQFKWRKPYARHKKSCKPKAPEFFHCLYCNETFITANKKKNHVLSFHPYCRKWQKCTLCLPQKGIVDRNENGGGLPSLEEDATSFSSHLTLFNHLMETHSNVYFACRACKERFGCAEEARLHEMEVHDPEGPGGMSGAAFPRPKIFPCLECGRMFLAQEALSNHSCAPPPLPRPPRQGDGISPSSTPNPTSTSTDSLQSSIPSNSSHRRSSSHHHHHHLRPSTNRYPLSSSDDPYDPETLFYSTLSNNIRDNLLNHLDGRLDAGKPKQEDAKDFVKTNEREEEKKGGGGGGGGTATAIEGKSQADSKDISQGKVGGTRKLNFSASFGSRGVHGFGGVGRGGGGDEMVGVGSSPSGGRRGGGSGGGWGKYSFPPTYDGRCGLTSYIRDTSYLDLSTQLIMRRNLQRLLPPTPLQQEETTTPKAKDEVNCEKETEGETSRMASSSTLPPSNSKLDVPSILDLERLGAECAESFGFPSSQTQGGIGGSEVTVGELSGEWVRERTYICSVCSWETPCLWTMEDHKFNHHPYIHCPQHELVGENRLLSKLIYTRLVDVEAPFGPTRRAWEGVEGADSAAKCTKCDLSGFKGSKELHIHILDCAGVGGGGEGVGRRGGGSGGGSRKEPSSTRKRKRLRRGLRRNIPSTPQHPPSRSKPMRTKPGDSETIQKMIANLPAKRATRRAIGFDEMDIKTRSQVTIQNVRPISKIAKRAGKTPIKSCSPSSGGVVVHNQEKPTRKGDEEMESWAVKGDVMSGLRMMRVSSMRGGGGRRTPGNGGGAEGNGNAIKERGPPTLEIEEGGKGWSSTMRGNEEEELPVLSPASPSSLPTLTPPPQTHSGKVSSTSENFICGISFVDGVIKYETISSVTEELEATISTWQKDVKNKGGDRRGRKRRKLNEEKTAAISEAASGRKKGGRVKKKGSRENNGKKKGTLVPILGRKGRGMIGPGGSGKRGRGVVIVVKGVGGGGRGRRKKKGQKSKKNNNVIIERKKSKVGRKKRDVGQRGAWKKDQENDSGTKKGKGGLPHVVKKPLASIDSISEAIEDVVKESHRLIALKEARVLATRAKKEAAKAGFQKRISTRSKRKREEEEERNLASKRLLEVEKEKEEEDRSAIEKDSIGDGGKNLEEKVENLEIKMEEEVKDIEIKVEGGSRSIEVGEIKGRDERIDNVDEGRKEEALPKSSQESEDEKDSQNVTKDEESVLLTKEDEVEKEDVNEAKVGLEEGRSRRVVDESSVSPSDSNQGEKVEEGSQKKSEAENEIVFGKEIQIVEINEIVKIRGDSAEVFEEPGEQEKEEEENAIGTNEQFNKETFEEDSPENAPVLTAEDKVIDEKMEENTLKEEKEDEQLTKDTEREMEVPSEVVCSENPEKKIRKKKRKKKLLKRKERQKSIELQEEESEGLSIENYQLVKEGEMSSSETTHSEDAREKGIGRKAVSSSWGRAGGSGPPPPKKRNILGISGPRGGGKRRRRKGGDGIKKRPQIGRGRCREVIEMGGFKWEVSNLDDETTNNPVPEASSTTVTTTDAHEFGKEACGVVSTTPLLPPAPVPIMMEQQVSESSHLTIHFPPPLKEESILLLPPLPTPMIPGASKTMNLVTSQLNQSQILAPPPHHPSLLWAQSTPSPHSLQSGVVETSGVAGIITASSVSQETSTSSLGTILDSVNKLLNDPEEGGGGSSGGGYNNGGSQPTTSSSLPQYSLADLQRAMGASDAEMAVLQQLGESSIQEGGVMMKEEDEDWGETCIMDLDNQQQQQGVSSPLEIPLDGGETQVSSSPIVPDAQGLHLHQVQSGTEDEEEDEIEKRRRGIVSSLHRYLLSGVGRKKRRGGRGCFSRRGFLLPRGNGPPPPSLIPEEGTFGQGSKSTVGGRGLESEESSLDDPPPLSVAPIQDPTPSSRPPTLTPIMMKPVPSGDALLIEELSGKEVVCPNCSEQFLGFPALHAHMTSNHQPQTNSNDPSSPNHQSTVLGLRRGRLEPTRLVCFECRMILPRSIMADHLSLDHSLPRELLDSCQPVDLAEGGERLKSKMSNALGDLLDRAVNNLIAAKKSGSPHQLSSGAVQLLTKLCAIRRKDSGNRNRVKEEPESIEDKKLKLTLPSAIRHSRQSLLTNSSCKLSPRHARNSSSDNEALKYENDWREAPSPLGGGSDEGDRGDFDGCGGVPFGGKIDSPFDSKSSPSTSNQGKEEEGKQEVDSVGPSSSMTPPHNSSGVERNQNSSPPIAPLSHSDGRVHPMCLDCGLGFSSLSELNSHRLDLHPSPLISLSSPTRIVINPPVTTTSTLAATSHKEGGGKSLMIGRGGRRRRGEGNNLNLMNTGRGGTRGGRGRSNSSWAKFRLFSHFGGQESVREKAEAALRELNLPRKSGGGGSSGGGSDAGGGSARWTQSMTFTRGPPPATPSQQQQPSSNNNTSNNCQQGGGNPPRQGAMTPQRKTTSKDSSFKQSPADDAYTFTDETS